jgi:hypothetical protein
MNAAAPDIQAAADEATKPSTVVHIAVPRRAGTRTFRGNGSLSLGTLRVRRPSHFYWTSDAPYFSLSERDARFYIDSGASAGKSAVEPGHYRAVKVSSIGDWTLRVVPDR